MEGEMKNVKARQTNTHGPVRSWQEVTQSLPRRERMVFEAILGRLLGANPGQWNPVEIDVFDVSKQIGLKHDEVSDAVRSLAARRFHVIQGPKKVFEYPLFIINGYHLREVGKPIESVLVAVAHETEYREDADDSWVANDGSHTETLVDRLIEAVQNDRDVRLT